MRQEWLEVSHKLRSIHPVMIKKLDLLEETIAKGGNAAKACDPEGVSLGIEICKQVEVLLGDVEHLQAVGILTGETCLRFSDELERYAAGEFEHLFQEFAQCLGGETEREILAKLVQHASSLNPWGQQLLVKFALEIRELEREGGSVVSKR